MAHAANTAAAAGGAVGGRAGRGGGRGGAGRGVGRVRGRAVGREVVEAVGHGRDRNGVGWAGAPGGGGSGPRYGCVGARLERRGGGHRVWAEPDLSRIDK